jgi:hypothetical protein
MKNLSYKTWVLVYEENRVVAIIEPGLKTECGGVQILKEFNTKEELDKYIFDNSLVKNNSI